MSAAISRVEANFMANSYRLGAQRRSGIAEALVA